MAQAVWTEKKSHMGFQEGEGALGKSIKGVNEHCEYHDLADMQHGGPGLASDLC